jgi:hypothetical protein
MMEDIPLWVSGSVSLSDMYELVYGVSAELTYPVHSVVSIDDAGDEGKLTLLVVTWMPNVEECHIESGNGPDGETFDASKYDVQ